MCTSHVAAYDTWSTIEVQLRNTFVSTLLKDRPPRDSLWRVDRFATFTTQPYSFQPRWRLFGSHLARSEAGTTSVRGCYRSRRLLLPYDSPRTAPTQAG